MFNNHLPNEIGDLVDKNLVLKIAFKDFNLLNQYSNYGVVSMTENEKILEELCKLQMTDEVCSRIKCAL